MIDQRALHLRMVLGVAPQRVVVVPGKNILRRDRQVGSGRESRAVVLQEMAHVSGAVEHDEASGADFEAQDWKRTACTPGLDHAVKVRKDLKTGSWWRLPRMGSGVGPGE